MGASFKAAAPTTAQEPAQLAKLALRRLVMEKLEPTPENYARAYQQEAGIASPGSLPERAQRLVERLSSRAFDHDAAHALARAMAEGRWDLAERTLDAPDDGGHHWAVLIDRIVRGVERRSKQWTSARKRDSLQRVLDGSAGDASRLQQRLKQLVASWESDTGEASGVTEPAPLMDIDAPAEAQPLDEHALISPLSLSIADDESAAAVAGDASAAWNRVVASLDCAVREAMPPGEVNSQRLAEALADVTRRIASDGATNEAADEIAQLCESAQRVMKHRHHLVDQLGDLCRNLTESLVDLAEDDSWAQGQCTAMRARIDEGLTARGVKSVSELLRGTRERQHQLRVEREEARNALKAMIQRMLAELDVLGSQTGRFHESVGRYADVIEKADSLESLAGAVREMVEESRSVQSLVSQTQERLNHQHSKASELTQRVTELEAELRRLSEEVSTDPLTQIANRRGLVSAFEAERARCERGGGELAIALLDIDNFKRLNDQLGHAAGDEALRSLAARVSATLRPTDVVARYGGEEFVVLLPETPVDEAQQILSRLQRSLTGGLFMHEQQQVFVTFSAGVTSYRNGERIEDALERSDHALYEAKRTGKNRTCQA